MIQGRKKGRRTKPEFRYLAVVELNKEQVLLFDKMLDCYRQPGRATTPTSRRITLKQYEGGRSRIAEHYETHNSRVSLREDALPSDLAILGISGGPVLSLGQVASLAWKAHQAKRTAVAYVPADPHLTYASLKASIKVRTLRDQQKGQRTLEAVPDYDVLRMSFFVRKAWAQGEYVSSSGVFWCTLVPRNPGTVDSACWAISNEKYLTKMSAKWFLNAFAATESAVSRHPWMQKWKQQREGRWIDADILDSSPLGETPEKIEESVLPAWKHAGFAGLPAYQVHLRRPDNTWIELYLGEEETRALAVGVDPPKLTKDILHPVDELDVLFYPEQKAPGYAVVLPDGTAWVNTRPK